MNSLSGFVRAVAKLCDKMAQFGVFAMLVLVVVSIVMRQFGKPLAGTYDYVGFVLALTVSFSLAHCAFERGHTRVEMLVDRFAPRVAALTDTLTGLISFAFFAVITWQCVALAGNIRRSGEVSMTALVPFYPYIYGMAFGCGLLAVAILVESMDSLGKAVKK